MFAPIAAGLVFFGGGVAASGTTADLDVGKGAGVAWSIDLSLEYSRLLVLGKFESFSLGKSGDASMFSIRAGVFLGRGNIAPYLAAGVGGLDERINFAQESEGYGGESSGLALIGEIGVTFFRDDQLGHAAVFLEWVQPTFDVDNNPYHYYGGPPAPNVPILAGGVRLQL